MSEDNSPDEKAGAETDSTQASDCVHAPSGSSQTGLVADRNRRQSENGTPPPESLIHAFVRRNRDALVKDAIVGGVVAALAFGGASWWDTRLEERQFRIDERRFSRQESLENTRFVRQVVIDGSPIKPFAGLNLAEAPLRGLQLGCTDSSDPGTCADFTEADLSYALLFDANLAGANLTRAALAGAYLASADLTGADFTDAHLPRAELFDADLTGANLTGADLTGAILTGADLTGADLTSADLTGANLAGANLTNVAHLDDATLDGVCIDQSTRWPEGFAVPDADPCTNSLRMTAPG